MNDMKQKDDTMRATPETDVSTFYMNDDNFSPVVNQAFARKLERQRDEAKDLVREILGIMQVSLVRAYTAGYHYGHEATVENNFIPVHKSEDADYHRDSIRQMLCDGSLPEAKEVLGEA